MASGKTPNRPYPATRRSNQYLYPQTLLKQIIIQNSYISIEAKEKKQQYL